MTPQELKLIIHRLYEIQSEVAKLMDGNKEANPMKLFIKLREDLQE